MAFGDLYRETQLKTKKEAKLSRASISGKVAAVFGRRYDIECPGGDYYRKVSCINPNVDLSIGEWVTLEWTQTDWQIIGYTSSTSG